MYDDELIERGEQDTTPETDLETDTESVEADVSEVEEEEIEAEETTEEAAEELPALPEKFKHGDKEYTPAEFEAMVKAQQEAEAQKVEAEKIAYQPRALDVIEADLKKENLNFENDALSIKKKYLAIAADQKDEAGNGYTAEEAFEHALKTQQWDYFLACLSPIEAVKFQEDRDKLAADYMPKFQNLNKEKEYISFTEKKKEDVKQWDSFKEANLKDLKGATHLIDKLKNNFSFNEKGVKEFLQWYEEAKALDSNTRELSAANEAAKQGSMNSTITGAKPQGKTRIFSDVEVEKMSAKEYAKHEKEIDRQIKAGIFKVTQQ